MFWDKSPLKPHSYWLHSINCQIWQPYIFRLIIMEVPLNWGAVFLIIKSKIKFNHLVTSFVQPCILIITRRPFSVKGLGRFSCLFDKLLINFTLRFAIITLKKQVIILINFIIDLIDFFRLVWYHIIGLTSAAFSPLSTAGLFFSIFVI